MLLICIDCCLLLCVLALVVHICGCFVLIVVCCLFLFVVGLVLFGVRSVSLCIVSWGLLLLGLDC